VEDGWEILAKVKFTRKLMKPYNEYFLVPLFDSHILAYKGKDFTLTGYYIPIELENSKTIILSKVPNSQCFFHGGAGPESVAEIIFPANAPKLKPDQIITVTGKLKLNDSDVEHMNFILENARIIPSK
jgi:hypothetical protein